MTYRPNTDFMLDVARGRVAGVVHVNKFGRNSDIDSGTAPEDIWDGGGIYVAPTANRLHDIASTDTQDTGIVQSSGTATSGSLTILVDSGATFSSDGVVVNDMVLIDTTQDHSLVESVDSETQLTIRTMHHNVAVANGQDYRIVHPSGTGAAVAHLKLAGRINGEQNSEFVILAGTNPVSTIQEYYRITRMHIHGVGSNDTNVGTITATASGDATVTAQINPGNGQTQMAFQHIPRGKTGYIMNLNVTMNKENKISNAMADLSIRRRLWGDANDGENIAFYLGVAIEGGPYIKIFNPPMRIPAEEDVWVRCEGVTDDNTDISASFDIILVDD